MVVPATTDPEKLAASIKAAPDTSMRVVFSTYHSAAVVGEAQRIGGFGSFDLVICDEAHRTTGVQLSTEDTKAFQLIHDDANIEARKRLYMTATPRVYKPSQKTKAAENEAFLSSMDDEATYGPEFFKLSFREAVDLGELTDYKVLILTVEEEAVNEAFQRHTADLGEVNLPEAAQMVGCLNALAKRERVDDTEDVRAFRPGDTTPLQRAVAFSNTIRASKHFASEFERIAAEYQYVTNVGEPLSIQTDHVDGSQRTVERTRKLDWLRDQPGESISRILSNAKCLTEGIDVPSLDAVLFLEPRKSQVDIIQAVGRVMRTSPGKDFGYIVIPIAVPPGTPPEGVLKDGRFKTVWQVLSALRSHDPDMNRDINQIRFGKKPKNVDIIDASPDLEVDDPTPPETDEDGAKASDTALADQLQLEFDVKQFQELCWAAMVPKVGDTAYLKRWAKNVADIAAALEERIAILASTQQVEAPFGRFVDGLRSNLNDQISTGDAVAMLAQHIITRPVFDSIFADYSLLSSNPIAQAMQEMLEVLEDSEVESETRELDAFYESVSYHIDGLDDPHARQQILIELYEEFFKTAFPKRSASLGIVYTPIEVTDFIVRAADDALRLHFDNASLSDRDVHILDPFTGTGTFIVQLLRSGLVRPDDLLRKFNEELHANEIQLLAYYIATVNIETAFHSLTAKQGLVETFPGIVYTDTFQLAEVGDGTGALDVFPINNTRADRQRNLDIRVIIGNPPYSVGKDNETDSNDNLKYPNLDGSILATYAERSSARLKRNIYDSYVRALRLASNQVLSSESGGVVCFVTNGGYVNGTSLDGLRASMLREFNHVYCYNLRGDQNTVGARSRAEGGKIFGSGSKSPVAITLLVKTSAPVPNEGGQLHYRDIGDGLDRETKLATLAKHASSAHGPLASVAWEDLQPTDPSRWIDGGTSDFGDLYPLTSSSQGDPPPIFREKATGIVSGRDRWNFNFSRPTVIDASERMTAFYNEEVDRLADLEVNWPKGADDRRELAETLVRRDPARLSWTRSDYGRVANAERYATDHSLIVESVYRPFTRQWVNFHPRLSSTLSQLPRIFPTGAEERRLAIAIKGKGRKSEFGCLMVDAPPSLHVFVDGTTVLPRHIDPKPAKDRALFDSTAPISAISPEALSEFQRATEDDAITDDDLFFYVYGVLHSADFREKYSANLESEEPRVPVPTSSEQFWIFSDAGRALSDLHTDYLTADPFELKFDDGPLPERVDRLRFTDTTNPTTLVVNDSFQISEIPVEAHRYTVGSRSALAWLVDQFEVKVDQETGIGNDPNTWDPAGGKFVLDLVQKIVTISLETLAIVDDLPALS